MNMESGWCRVERTAEGVGVLELYGDQDLTTKDEIEAAIGSLATEERHVVLDLSRTQFVDSAVLHSIYSFAARQTDAGRRLVLQVALDSAVRRALEVVGLLDRLPWAPEREQAIALLRNDDPSLLQTPD